MTASPAAYLGSLGQTQRQNVHVRCPDGSAHVAEVFEIVNNATDPELGRMLRGEAGRPLNTLIWHNERPPLPVDVAVIYHDPVAAVFALIVPESQRYREIRERIRVLELLDADRSVPVPDYVLNFATVVGVGELRAYLERRSVADGGAAAVTATQSLALETERQTLRAEAAALAQQRQEVAALAESVEIRAAELQAQLEALAPAAEVVALDEGDVIGETAPVAAFSQLRECETLCEELAARSPAAGDSVLEQWISAQSDKYIGLDRGRARALLSLSDEKLEPFAQGPVGIQLQLHRFPSCPLIVCHMGRPDVLRGETRGTILTFYFDVLQRPHRELLQVWGREFVLQLEVYDGDYLPVRRLSISAPLAENVELLVLAAKEHSSKIDAGARSMRQAIRLYEDPAYDRSGRFRAEYSQFSESKLLDLSSPRAVRRALAIAKYFANDVRENQLIAVRGYPRLLWRLRRRAALEAALRLGVWPGRTLSDIAVQEQLAPSYEAFLKSLLEHFAKLDAAGGGDLDPEERVDNWKSLDEEAARLGMTKPRRAVTARPERAPSVVSGTIAEERVAETHARTSQVALHDRSQNELLALLEQEEMRVAAAVELARRGTDAAIGPVFNLLNRMTRSEAVKVLGSSLGFGPRAIGAWITALRSKKAYLRHGAAMALVLQKRADAVAAALEQLVGEPTDVWREIARAMRYAGPDAVPPLLSAIEGLPTDTHDRVAWALAHLAAEYGASVLGNAALGVVGQVVTQALALVGQARADQDLVLGGQTAAGQNVNQLFTRAFLQAAGVLGALPQQHSKGDATVVLRESDLMLDDDL